MRIDDTQSVLHRSSRAAVWSIAVLGMTLSFAAYGQALVWAGCGISKKAYMSELAVAFTEKTGYSIELVGGGATEGIRSVAEGRNQMGGSCRLPLRSKHGKVDPREADAQMHQVAWDAIAVTAHPSNGVINISLADLKKVYRGEIKNWRELGGVDRPIKLVAREGKDSGVGYMFRRMVLEDPDADFPDDSVFVKSTGPLEKTVEDEPDALAVDGVSSARRSEVKILTLDGVAPTKQNISNGTYFLFRPLFLLTDIVNPHPATLAFIEFALSDEGQAIISNTGTVNLEEGENLNKLWQVRLTKLRM